VGDPHKNKVRIEVPGKVWYRMPPVIGIDPMIVTSTARENRFQLLWLVNDDVGYKAALTSLRAICFRSRINESAGKLPWWNVMVQKNPLAHAPPSVQETFAALEGPQKFLYRPVHKMRFLCKQEIRVASMGVCFIALAQILPRTPAQVQS
jgi:hypothetical protein